MSSNRYRNNKQSLTAHFSMQSDTKSTSDASVVIPIEYIQHQTHVRRMVVTIPGKCIGRTKVTHEILIRFNWSRMSLGISVFAILMAATALVVLLLN